MPYSDTRKVVALSDKIRKAGNELIDLMRKNYDQLMRTKKYRKLRRLYGGELKNADTGTVKQYIFPSMANYHVGPEGMDKKAVETLVKEAYCIDTYRPCYAALVPKIIRGKYRISLHLTIEGNAKAKKDR